MPHRPIAKVQANGMLIYDFQSKLMLFFFVWVVWFFIHSQDIRLRFISVYFVFFKCLYSVQIVNNLFLFIFSCFRSLHSYHRRSGSVLLNTFFTK